MLSQGPAYRDEIIRVGQYRSHPCKHPLRMVSVLCQGVWYRYLTNVLDPQVLSARQVCELYRRRWRIEDAFAVTKRVLDLAYLWTGSANAVQLQIYATLLFYAVLLTICQQVAQVLGEPLERISVEMVFQAFYHYSHALQCGEADDLVRFWAKCHSDMVRTPVLSFQLLQQHPRLLEVGRVKTLGKPAIDRRQQLIGLGTLPLLLPQAGQAECGP